MNPITRFSFVIVASAGIALNLFTLSANANENPITSSKNNSKISIHRVTPLLDSGNSVDWSGVNNRLLVGKPGVNQYYNVYSITPDGYRLKSLTLDKDRSTPRQHNGSASWHPSGDYFVFTSQNSGSSSFRMSLPGTGLNCNLWLGDREGNRFWRLTSITTSYTSPKGVVYPYFSPDGTKLFWSGNTGDYPRYSLWGVKALYVADFSLSGGNPEIANIRTLQPGIQKDFYESHGFSPDGNKLIFSGNLKEDQPVFGMDIYTYDLRNSKATALTDSFNVWDEFGAFSPDGQKIVYASSAGQEMRRMGFRTTNWQQFLKSELWIMNADGSDPQQLSRFNTPGSMEHIQKRSFMGDCAWSPDGTRIAVCVNYETRNYDVAQKVVILDLGIGAPPSAPEKAADSQEPKTNDSQSRQRPQNVTPRLPFRW